KFLPFSLVRHLNGLEQALPKPLGERTEVFQRFVLVGLFFDAGGNVSEFESSSVQFKTLGKRLILSGQAKKHFVRLFLIRITGRIKGLNEIEIEVTLWHCRRAIVRRTEEQVSKPPCFAVRPF